MRTLVARAMQIASLELGEIERIHELENLKGHPMPNWNVQKLLRKSPLKEIYGINDNQESITSHVDRIERDLEKLSLFSKGHKNTLDVDDMHSFDWGIHHNAGNIVWSFSGPTASGGVLQRMRKAS